jgi:anti-sigma regulatory factor (Ser/Thr protein kinase)
MPESGNWSHETTLAAEPGSVARARDFVRLHLVAHQLAGLVEDVRLVISELATNAVVHAGTPFAVTLSSVDECIRLVLRDGSPSIPVRSTPDVMDMSGRGLMLVELLSREWGVAIDHDGVKSVWANFPHSQERQ